MNIITISHCDQFNLIFNDSLYLSGEQSDEINHNMWCISLRSDFIKNIKLEQLKYFVNKLIENREQQLKNMNFYKSAIFYMWFDLQALQLRFNIITGDAGSLPFRCKVRLHTASELILNNFINTLRDIALCGDQIEFFNKEEAWSDEDESEEYILDVFVKKLGSAI
jgi:hypothetical protein